MQKIRLPVSDGVKEFIWIPGDLEFESAKASGDIHIGDEIVYKNYVVGIIDNFEMLVLDTLQMVGGFDPGMPDMDSFSAEMPDMGSWQQAPGGMQWSFTINGQPVSPDQFNAAMGGGGPIH